MKRLSLIAVLLLAPLAARHSALAADALVRCPLTVGGVAREALLYAPAQAKTVPATRISRTWRGGMSHGLRIDLCFVKYVE